MSLTVELPIPGVSEDWGGPLNAAILAVVGQVNDQAGSIAAAADEASAATTAAAAAATAAATANGVASTAAASAASAVTTANAAAGAVSTLSSTVGTLGTTVSALSTTVAGKVGTTDPRLSDARTPTTHSHSTSQVAGLDAALAERATTTSLAAVVAAAQYAIPVLWTGSAWPTLPTLPSASHWYAFDSHWDVAATAPTGTSVRDTWEPHRDSAHWPV